MSRSIVLASILFAASAQAVLASDTPLYQPQPGWVTPVALPDAGAQSEGGSPILLLDLQQRIEGGQLSSYIDTATKISSAEQLTQLANLTIPWMPDKGDFIVHELSIQRGKENIDLLAKGQRFTVLRREESLEQRELTGLLSATLAVEGLQIGDILRVRITTTARDKALAGNVQNVAFLPAAPLKIGQGRLRLTWPAKEAPTWKALASDVLAKPVRKGDSVELVIPLPVAKQPDMAGDAPMRYRRPPLLELSTFSSWAEVSRVFAPLYKTDAAIAPGSELDRAVADIVVAEATPLGRAQRALQLVQDKVRYLAVGMDGGNYVPQSPVRTWELRYGDCKAKTLLLLSLLRAMNIDAEPALAHIGLGDLVRDRLPSAAAFNHVLVRATVGGETLWLDGTGSGSRLADIRDTPAWRTVLPLRASGAELLDVATHPNARPMIDFSISADESASTDVPSVFDAKAVIRGPIAAQLTLASAQFGEKERRQLVQGFLYGFLGEAQVSTASITPNSEDGTVTLAARGAATTPWSNDDRRRKRALATLTKRIEFMPDRGRPAWTALPVAATDLAGTRIHMSLKLPDGGKGFVIEGEPNLKAEIAGYVLSRNVKLADGVVEVDERLDGTGAEVTATQIPAARDALATVLSRSPVITAPQETKRRWELDGADPKGASQVAAADAIFAKAIANDPSDATGFRSRASFRAGIGDRKGALADLASVIKLEPSVDLYLWRAGVNDQIGDSAAALADAQAARALDPSAAQAIGASAWYLAKKGDLVSATRLIDERIALGGKTKSDYQLVKANLLGEWGETTDAIKLLDGLIVDKPGSPALLNARCWIKGIRNVMLESALKDCTSSIELSERSEAALDSRAMVFFRMGRLEDALGDLDSVLASSPSIAQSHFLRAVILTRLGRADEADKELSIARRLDPAIDSTNSRYGIKP